MSEEVALKDQRETTSWRFPSSRGRSDGSVLAVPPVGSKSLPRLDQTVAVWASRQTEAWQRIRSDRWNCQDASVAAAPCSMETASAS